MKEIKQLGNVVSEMKSTVKKEVDNAVNLKMGNSIQARAKEEVKRHIKFFSKSPEKKMSQASPDGDPDNSDSSENSSEGKEENSINDSDKDFEYLPELVHLPRITYKSTRNKSSKYHTYEYPVSPLDKSYKVGCNDDLVSTGTSSSKSLNSDQRKAANQCKDWVRQLRQPSPSFAKVSTSTSPFKRTPLPT